jgi:hypothetical protein
VEKIRVPGVHLLFYYTCLGKKLGHIAEKAKQMIPDISKVIYQPKAGKKSKKKVR